WRESRVAIRPAASPGFPGLGLALGEEPFGRATAPRPVRIFPDKGWMNPDGPDLVGVRAAAARAAPQARPVRHHVYARAALQPNEGGSPRAPAICLYQPDRSPTEQAAQVELCDTSR